MKDALFDRVQRQNSSVNNVIQWGEHLSVEHPVIDAQHKAIFDLGSDFYENWRSGASVDLLRPAVDKLGNLMHAHFTYEERVLTNICYSGLIEHAAEHRIMLDKLQIMQDYVYTFKLDQKVRRGSLQTPGWKIMELIFGFTVGHLMSSDMSYSLAIMASRNGMPKEELKGRESRFKPDRLGAGNVFGSD